MWNFTIQNAQFVNIRVIRIFKPDFRTLPYSQLTLIPTTWRLGFMIDEVTAPRVCLNIKMQSV